MMSSEKITMGKIVVATVLIAMVCSPVFALSLNDPAPDFSLRDVKGNVFSLVDVVGARKKEELHGVVLSFFATWCVPCRTELPLMNSLVDELQGKGVKVVLVGFKEKIDRISALLTDLRVDKPVVVNDQSGEVGEKYGVRFLPITFFIGGDGTVKHIIYGEITDAEELRAAAKLLH
jgi:cytochrome c biogenesis protein CcmG, thiol:disulfide interchange protein DsbE